jgi:Na+-transporting methylmalonyl-CoA/oxaloacetate decarboxylase gamma subunit
MNKMMLMIDWSEIWIITVVGYVVVFLALVLLVLCFQSLPKVLGLGMRGAEKVRDKKRAREMAGNQEKYISGEVSAAIGLALALYFKEQHDEESGVLTIKRVSRTYSPWSSKIYGVNNFPGRK